MLAFLAVHHPEFFAVGTGFPRRPFLHALGAASVWLPGVTDPLLEFYLASILYYFAVLTTWPRNSLAAFGDELHFISGSATRHPCQLLSPL